MNPQLPQIPGSMPTQNPGLTTASDFSQSPITQSLGQNSMQVVAPPVPPQAGQQSIQGSLHPAHNAIYEKLRQVLMNLHQQGVPGMDQVLSALNGQHVKLSGKQPLGKNPATPQNPTPQGSYSGQ